MAEWHDDLKTCLMQAGVDDKSVVFLFNDTQVNCWSLRALRGTPLLWEDEERNEFVSLDRRFLDRKKTADLLL